LAAATDPSVTFIFTYAMPKYAELYKGIEHFLAHAHPIVLRSALPARNYIIALIGLVVGGAHVIFIWTSDKRSAGR